SAVHIVAMNAFANKSTLTTFLRQYQDENIQVFDNKYQPHKAAGLCITLGKSSGISARNF
ncbi:11872_t:CDS:2, partial [Gigaspora rosea]